MGNVPKESGRTVPHLPAITQHVAERCRAQQPLIRGEHPRNLPRVSLHTEHQNGFISPSFHTVGSFLALFSFYVYAMSKYSYSFSFIETLFVLYLVFAHILCCQNAKVIHGSL